MSQSVTYGGKFTNWNRTLTPVVKTTTVSLLGMEPVAESWYPTRTGFPRTAKVIDTVNRLVNRL